MRSPVVLVALVGLAGCDSRYGTYFEVQSAGHLKFDHVEFFFGKLVDAQLPTSPGHPVLLPPGTARIATRLYADSDDDLVAGPVAGFSYYLTDTTDNRELGDVAIAVASLNGQPVGIAELDNFKLATGEVYRYDLALAPYASEDAEVWGRLGPHCVRWARPQSDGTIATVAIVRGDDLDCDGFIDAGVDCDPLRYCDGSGHGDCEGAAACIVDVPSCQLGGCVNADGVAPRVCTPTTCIDPQVCAACNLADPLAALLQCAVYNGPHTDHPITVRPGQLLCTEPYTFELALANGVACSNPRLETSADYQVPLPLFTYAVAQSGANCSITMSPKVPGTPYSVVGHLLLSIDDPAGGARIGFIVGISAAVGPCGPAQVLAVAPTLGVCP